MEKTNDGKKGGWLVGKRHYDKSGKPIGGIPAVVGDSKRPVELEGGEVIINREASKKYWRELSKINQSAGNGVPIKPQDVGADEDPEEYKEGGKVIEFNPNHIPNKRIYNYAKSIKEDYPKVWGLGGNIFGNEAFKNLERVINRGYWTDNEEWMYIKWRSFVARHKGDFRIAGVIAMLKWIDKVDKGWEYMKNLIEAEIDKRYPKKKKGGAVVTYKNKYNKKYGYDKNESHDLSEISKDTGVSGKGLRQIYNKGVGAYKTNPQSVRPNVKSKEQWAMGRVYSAVMGGKAARVDAKELKMETGGSVEHLISEGIVDLKMYDTTNEHSKLYGFDAKNPLYIQSIIVAKEHRNKGIGSKVMKYINDYAKKNEHDLIFGHITQKAQPNIDVIKSMMVKSGFNTCEGNNDFYKQIYADGGLIAPNGNGELAKGIKTEQEHKDTLEKIASGEITVNQAIKMTAKDHLKENPKYYTELAKIEKHDVGGALSSYALKTPNGEKSRLTYLQQILVRTEKFKEFFGDWETAAKNYLLDNKENYKVHFKNVSKVMDMSTLEPRVVYHGTRSDAEFFTFDVSMEKGQGRPYAYFAHNREYSENFTEFSQRGHTNSSGYLYECFLNVRNPFMAMGHEYEFKLKDYEGWINAITGTIAFDKYQTIEKNETTKKLEKAIRAQVEDYMSSLNNEKNQFWKYMAADTKSVFKFFLISYGYDGIFYGEEIANNYDAENPKEYTNAVTIFSAKDIKLADGRNLNFNPMETDIRYEDGGSVEKPQKTMSKKDRLGSILFGEKYANGGFIEDTIGYKSVEKPMDDARTFVEQLNKKMKE
jgi:GNAT superfamily N-acetyltransferase